METLLDANASKYTDNDAIVSFYSPDLKDQRPIQFINALLDDNMRNIPDDELYIIDDKTEVYYLFDFDLSQNVFFMYLI